MLTLGKNAARARDAALSGDVVNVGASQYEAVSVETVELGQFGVYEAHTPRRVSQHASELAMNGDTRSAPSEVPGLAPDPQNFIAPAIGSANLTAPRFAGGVSGHARHIRPTGPIGGPSSEWTGNRGQLPQMQVGAAGPVGTLDYSAQLAAAYAAANRRVLDQAVAEAQLVSAV